MTSHLDSDVLAVELTTDEIAELRGVVKGADVWGLANAMRLRSIQQKAPSLIDIVPAMEKPEGRLRQPYFGCIATAAGRAYLRAINRRKRAALAACTREKQS